MNPEKIIHIAELAGEKILQIYNRDEKLQIIQKGDNSPLTDADLAAHNIIINNLKKLDNTPIISEEGIEGDPTTSNTCWLVDPLDGTKEFIKKKWNVYSKYSLDAERERTLETSIWSSSCTRN